MQCVGPEAAAYTARWLFGQVVRLEDDVERRDIYGRRLASVYLDGHNFEREGSCARDTRACSSSNPTTRTLARCSTTSSTHVRAQRGCGVSAATYHEHERIDVPLVAEVSRQRRIEEKCSGGSQSAPRGWLLRGPTAAGLVASALGVLSAVPRSSPVDEGDLDRRGDPLQLRRSAGNDRDVWSHQVGDRGAHVDLVGSGER